MDSPFGLGDVLLLLFFPSSYRIFFLFSFFLPLCFTFRLDKSQRLDASIFIAYISALCGLLYFFSCRSHLFFPDDGVRCDGHAFLIIRITENNRFYRKAQSLRDIKYYPNSEPRISWSSKEKDNKKRFSDREFAGNVRFKGIILLLLLWRNYSYTVAINYGYFECQIFQISSQFYV